MRAAIVLLLAAASAAWGQSEQTGAIRGVVTDQAGARISRARVWLRNPALAIAREATAGQDGVFLILGLPPGTGYVLEAAAPSFNTSRKELAPVMPGSTAEEAIALAVEGQRITLDVTSEVQPVVTNAPEVSQTVDARRVSELPSNGRSLNRFALLNPHVRNTAGQGSDGAGATRLAVNASSFRHTNYRLDGNTNFESVYANAPQQQVSLTALQDFKVLTNQFSAEFGGTTSGIISTTTKSGTNHWHGEIFSFLRPSGIQARPPVSSLRVPNENWQTGGAISGPILRDRLTFFANYERGQQNRGSFIQSPVPATFIGEYRDHLALVRLDLRVSDSHSMSLRVNGNRNSNNNSNDAVSGFNQPSTARNSYVQNGTIQFTDRKTWGTWLNEFRASYLNTIPTAARPAGAASVVITRPNWSTEGTSSFSYTRTQNYQFADQLAAQLGRHELRIGLEYMRQTVVEDSYTPFGTYTFAPGPPQAGELPVQYSQTFGRQYLRYGQTQVSGFVQDNWRVRPRLTLNLGLRYEVQTLTAERNNFAPRLGFAWDVKGDGRTIVRGGGGIYYDQYYMYITRRYFYQGPSAYTATVTMKPSDAGFPIFPNSVPQVDANSVTAARDLYIKPERILNPYSSQFSLGVQQKLFAGLTLTIDGITQHTVRQMRPIDINAPSAFTRTAPGQTRVSAAADATRPFRTYGGVAVRQVVQVENTGTSNYDALDIGVVKPFSKKFQLEGHYTYNNATTDAMFFGEPNTGVPNDWNGNLRLEHGPSDFHQRHRFVGHSLISLPWKMQASFIATLASGLPLDPRTGVDNNGDSNVVDRPVNPATGTVFSRNSFRMPSQANFDISLAKTIHLAERLRLDLRAECFNLLNRTNAVRVNATWGNGSAPLATFLAPIAGVSNSDPARQFQFGLRLLF